MNREPDWALWRSFLAVLDAGSLSSAARAIGSSQPTLGRHVETLESHLGVTLFERSLTGLRPTGAALALAGSVRTARAALAEAATMAEGAAETPLRSVRITSSMIISHYVLPPILGELRRRFPETDVEIVASDTVENLLLREADIAIRLFRPTQLDLVARKLVDIPLVACAHERYLARRGTPHDIQGLRGHDLIGLDRSDLIVAQSAAIGLPLRREDFAFRCDSHAALWEMAKAGLGISFAQAGLVARTPGMVRLIPGFTVPQGLEAWLATHRELLSNPGIRGIYTALAELLPAQLSPHGQVEE